MERWRILPALLGKAEHCDDVRNIMSNGGQLVNSLSLELFGYGHGCKMLNHGKRKVERHVGQETVMIWKKPPAGASDVIQAIYTRNIRRK